MCGLRAFDFDLTHSIGLTERKATVVLCIWILFGNALLLGIAVAYPVLIVQYRWIFWVLALGEAVLLVRDGRRVRSKERLAANLADLPHDT